MKLSEEYKRQRIFRNWESYLEILNISNDDIILDLGCGTGEVTALLAMRAFKVIGIDNNLELIQEAEAINSADNIEYLIMDLDAIDYDALPLADGIWSSFVASYFPDFPKILKSWLNLLRPKGWFAITEMNDLFAHEPLSQSTQDVFKMYYQLQRSKGIYDFEMGSKLKNYFLSCGLQIIHEESKYDKELTFHGAASPEVLKSWDCRFERIYKFREFAGEGLFNKIKQEFLECLMDKRHVSKTEVKFIIGKK